MCSTTVLLCAGAAERRASCLPHLTRGHLPSHASKDAPRLPHDCATQSFVDDGVVWSMTPYIRHIEESWTQTGKTYIPPLPANMFAPSNASRNGRWLMSV